MGTISTPSLFVDYYVYFCCFIKIYIYEHYPKKLIFESLKKLITRQIVILSYG